MIDYTTRAAKFQPFAANGFAPPPFIFRTKKPGARRRRWGEPLYVRLVVNGGYGRSPRIERGEGRYSRFARERRGARGERCFCRLCTLRRSSELPNIGAPQLPLPTAKKGTRLGAFWWWEEDTYCRNPARGVPSAKRRGAKGEWCSRQLFTLRRSPELPNIGAFQLPLPTAKKGTRMGAFWWWEEVAAH